MTPRNRRKGGDRFEKMAERFYERFHDNDGFPFQGVLKRDAAIKRLAATLRRVARAERLEQPLVKKPLAMADAWEEERAHTYEAGANMKTAGWDTERSPFTVSYELPDETLHRVSTQYANLTLAEGKAERIRRILQQEGLSGSVVIIRDCDGREYARTESY